MCISLFQPLSDSRGSVMHNNNAVDSKLRKHLCLKRLWSVLFVPQSKVSIEQQALSSFSILLNCINKQFLIVGNILNSLAF